MEQIPSFPEILLIPVGIVCIAAAFVHGYLGIAKLIAPAEFKTRQARSFIVAIWHYSTVTWAAIGAVFVAIPWLVPEDDRRLIVGLLSLPLLYGVIGNFVISRGRHPGWAIFAFVVVAANAIVWV